MKKIMKTLIVGVTFYLVLGLAIFIFQKSFVYFPSEQDFYDCPGFKSAEKIQTGNTRMYVQKTTNQWVVFYHGNAGSACDRSYFLDLLDGTKFSYIVVEYAGYSSDPSLPSELSLLQNVKDVSNYINSQNAAKVIIVGESLGTALASYHSSLMQPYRLILISPFPDLSSVAQANLKMYPAKILLKDKYPADKWLSRVDHLTIVHGLEDQTIPAVLGERLFKSLAIKDKELVLVPGAGHNDMYDFQKTLDALSKYLK